MGLRGISVDLGLLRYEPSRQLQKAVWQLRVAAQVPDTLLLVEHPPVITLGRSARPDNLLVPEPELARRGIEFFRVERGGDVTFHGPGQLVGYPIFQIRGSLAGVRAFVERIEQALIESLGSWGIKAETRPGFPGVWVGEEKVAALGIAVSQGVSFHGFALNVNPDLAGFQLIRPCGIADRGVTSVSRLLGRRVSLSAARRQVIASFAATFGIEFEPAAMP